MRVCVTHFDGDPFILEFWLRLYKKHWRGEVDKIVMDVCYSPKLVPEGVVEYQKRLLDEFPEICTTWHDNKRIPELSNNEILKNIEGDTIMLTESDGFIFKRGIVDKCFREIESGRYDLVSAPFPIIPEVLRMGLGQGHMRCFMFMKKELLDDIEIDLMPRHLYRGTAIKGFTVFLDKEVDVDCFGWMSVQLSALQPKTLWTEANLCSPDFWDKSDRYEEYGWVHVRQMNSSALGFGCKFYEGFANRDKRIIREMKKALAGGVAAEWQYIKAIAFRLLILDTFHDENMDISYLNEYRNNIEEIAKLFKIDSVKIAEMKGYYKGLMRLQ